MRRSTSLVVVLLLVTAGCLGGSNGTGYLTVERVENLPQGDGAVSYDNLSQAQQVAFERALGGDGSVMLHEGTDRNEFIDPGYVRYDGDIYQTTVSVP